MIIAWLSGVALRLFFRFSLSFRFLCFCYVSIIAQWGYIVKTFYVFYGGFLIITGVKSVVIFTTMGLYCGVLSLLYKENMAQYVFVCKKCKFFSIVLFFVYFVKKIE